MEMHGIEMTVINKDDVVALIVFKTDGTVTTEGDEDFVNTRLPEALRELAVNIAARTRN